MNQIPAEMRDQLNFQASLLRLMGYLDADAAANTSDEKMAVEVEKLARGL